MPDLLTDSGSGLRRLLTQWADRLEVLVRGS